MPRPFRPMTAYPTEGAWMMTTIRLPTWLRDEINERAVRQVAEPWVSLMDLMARTRQLPPSRIPEYPLAVVRRYGSDLAADGFLATGQLDLGAFVGGGYAKPRPAPVAAPEPKPEQADGLACVVCAEQHGTMVPTGARGPSGAQLFAHERCLPAPSKPFQWTSDSVAGAVSPVPPAKKRTSATRTKRGARAKRAG